MEQAFFKNHIYVDKNSLHGIIVDLRHYHYRYYPELYQGIVSIGIIPFYFKSFTIQNILHIIQKLRILLSIRDMQ